MINQNNIGKDSQISIQNKTSNNLESSFKLFLQQCSEGTIQQAHKHFTNIISQGYSISITQKLFTNYRSYQQINKFLTQTNKNLQSINTANNSKNINSILSNLQSQNINQQILTYNFIKSIANQQFNDAHKIITTLQNVANDQKIFYQIILSNQIIITQLKQLYQNKQHPIQTQYLTNEDNKLLTYMTTLIDEIDILQQKQKYLEKCNQYQQLFQNVKSQFKDLKINVTNDQQSANQKPKFQKIQSLITKMSNHNTQHLQHKILKKQSQQLKPCKQVKKYMQQNIKQKNIIQEFKGIFKKLHLKDQLNQLAQKQNKNNFTNIYQKNKLQFKDINIQLINQKNWTSIFTYLYQTYFYLIEVNKKTHQYIQQHIGFKNQVKIILQDQIFIDAINELKSFQQKQNINQNLELNKYDLINKNIGQQIKNQNYCQILNYFKHSMSKITKILKILSTKIYQNKSELNQIQLFFKYFIQKNKQNQQLILLKQQKSQQYQQIYKNNSFQFVDIDIVQEFNKKNWVNIFIYLQQTSLFLIKCLHFNHNKAKELQNLNKNCLNNNNYIQMFPGSEIADKIQSKKFLYQQIQLYTNKAIQKTKLLCKNDPINRIDPYSYIADRKNIVLLIKTRKEKAIGGFTIPSFGQQNQQEGGFIFSIDIKEIFQVIQGKKVNKYDKNSIIFGNSELQLLFDQNLLKSFIGLKKKHFNTGQVNFHTILGQSQSQFYGQQIQLISYQLYQVQFQNDSIQKYKISPKKKDKSKILRYQQIQQQQQLQNQKKIRSYQNQNSKLKQQNQKLVDQISKLKQNNKQLGNKSNILYQQQNQSIFKIQKLQQEQKNKQIEYQNLKEQLQMINNQKIKKNQLQQQVKDLKKKNQQYQQNLKQINKLLGNNKQLAKENGDITKILQLKNQQLNKTKQKIRQLQQSNKQITKQLQKSNEQKEKNYIDLQQMKNSFQDLRKYYEDLKKSYEDIKNQIQDLKKRNQNIKINYQNQKLKNHTIQEEKKKLKEFIDQKGLRNIEKFFSGYVMDNQIQGKKFIINVIEKTLHKRLFKTNLLYRFDKLNKINFHQYIDNHPNVVVFIKLINNRIVGGFSESAFTENSRNQQGIIFCINNQKFFRKNLKYSQSKSITYDTYYIVFGKSELRIKALDQVLFSNLGINNGYYDSQGNSSDILFGEGKDVREVKMIDYQFFEMVFEKSN